jgi:hypothetical protein
VPRARIASYSAGDVRAGMAVLLVEIAGLPTDVAVSLTVATRLATLWFGVALEGLALLIAWQLPRQNAALDTVSS